MIQKSKLFILIGILGSLFSYSQITVSKNLSFTRADTLRGSLRPERNWWNVLRYDITIQPDYNTKTIRGHNTISFYDNGGKTMQLDLQQPMEIDSIISEGKLLSYQREGNVYWVFYRDSSKTYKIKPGNRTLTVYFHGRPLEAVRPPWDGGWIWKKDAQGRPWMSVACQGLGASVWYPCKDHQSDEPDNGASLAMLVPDSLVAVSNGRLKQKKRVDNELMSYTWEVKNPINTYNIIPYIGKYVNWTDTVMGEKGKLDMSYWILDYNLNKSTTHFSQAKSMMHCFEYWFGPYPFYEDSYKLIEAPFLGMEHQSGIAYGNSFKNGYLGQDLSGSGWGKNWDFIIIHESGHEWFGNNITSKDVADMWIHESFTNFSEVLYTQYLFGEKAGNEYCVGLRKKIANDEPIISSYGVNKEGSGGDMYYKGNNMLQTIRHTINDEKKFRKILRGLNKTFYHQTVTTQQIENYISQQVGFNYQKLFDQYLRTVKIPVLEYYTNAVKNELHYRYDNCISGFNLPLIIGESKLSPTDQWQTLPLNQQLKKDFNPEEIEHNYYITVKHLNEHSNQCLKYENKP